MKPIMPRATVSLVALVGAALAWSTVRAQVVPHRPEEIPPSKKEFSPYVNRANYPTNVYFGDTHLHTALSMDAGTFGNRLGLEEAYRFTRGETVTSATGYRARMGRPLDFVVVADHSDGMGFFSMFASGARPSWTRRRADAGTGRSTRVDRRPSMPPSRSSRCSPRASSRGGRTIPS